MTIRRALLVGALLVASIAGSSTSGALPLSTPPATRPYEPHTLLVAFRPDVDDASRAALHAANGAVVANTLAWQRLDVVRLPGGVDPVAAAAVYGRSPLVDFAEPNYAFRATSIPNDPNFGDLYGMTKISAPAGWDTAYGPGNFPSTGGVRVGIVDTGIDRSHADVGGKVKACAQSILNIGLLQDGSCNDDHGHGTHVAGTIAAYANNGLGVAGAAPNADLAICKALNAAGSGFTSDIVKCINWLRTTGGARIISMSIGSTGSTTAFDRELSAAYAAGVLLIAAAGNDGNGTLNYPAAHPDVVSVAATDANDQRASFSNCNADVEIAAPGVNVLSTAPGGGYQRMSGTSMATPHVSGVAAVVMWKKGLTAAQTRSVLDSTADDKGPGGKDTCYGNGRVNLARAVA
ncbi:MAG: thermitase [Actinomycetota bacterium]|jgi:thermitase|nr:thermitase [Actinomycetota bacterium]